MRTVGPANYILNHFEFLIVFNRFSQPTGASLASSNHAPKKAKFAADLQRMLDQAVTVTEPVTVNGAHRHHQYLG